MEQIGWLIEQDNWYQFIPLPKMSEAESRLYPAMPVFVREEDRAESRRANEYLKTHP